MDRRNFLASAAALGMAAIWAKRSAASPSTTKWREDRAVYPQGVASGDPDEHSVILWTRRPFEEGERHDLTVEVSRDSDFRQVIAAVRAPVLAAADWTCRVLVGGLKPATVYWYRFTDDGGQGSRIGRTITAPRQNDPRPVRFAFVSCQSVNEGAQNAYRRMIWEDERAPADQQLGFVLHLGDFIYEVVEYPDEVPHRYERTVYDIGRIPDARKVSNFHVPTTSTATAWSIARTSTIPISRMPARISRSSASATITNSRGRAGRASSNTAARSEPAQPLRVAANQAWWEYIPSRVRKASGDGLDQFGPPKVVDAPITTLDDHGFGDEPNNRAAIGSMTAYRALRYGRHVELILTDFHSYNMEDPTARPEADGLRFGRLPRSVAAGSWLEILDGGTEYDGGNPPATIAWATRRSPNFRKDEPRLYRAGARAEGVAEGAAGRIHGDVEDLGRDQRHARYAHRSAESARRADREAVAGHDYGIVRRRRFQRGTERARRDLRLGARQKVTGFVTVSGDRHSFWAGYAAKALPPAQFEPVGIASSPDRSRRPGWPRRWSTA